MRTLITAFSMFAMLAGSQALAEGRSDYDLEALDVLKTCKPGTIQEVNAQMALSYMNAHRWWNMKDQMDMHHSGYLQWHGSLSGVIAANPASNDAVPFRNGVLTNANFVKSFALVAFLNDITKYSVRMKRVDCVDDDNVVAVIDFAGFQVRRDERGCITHGLKYGSPGQLQFEFRDEKSGAGSVRRKLYRAYTHLNADYSLKVKADLAELAKGPSNVEPEAAKCKTYPQLVEEFQAQVRE